MALIMLKCKMLSKYIIFPPILHNCPICFLGTVHHLLLIFIFLLIYKLKYSQVGSCLIRLNAIIIDINFT